MPDTPFFSRAFLQEMARYNGFFLDDTRLDALMPVFERSYPGRARFRVFDPGDTEPAPVFFPEDDRA